MATVSATLVTPGFSTGYDLEQAALAAVGSIGESFASAFSGTTSVSIDPTYTFVTFSFAGGGSGSLSGSFPPVEPATWTINNMSLTAPNVFFGFNGSLSFNNSTGELVGAATFSSLDVITPSLSLSIGGHLTEDLSGNISGSIHHIEVDAGALHVDMSGVFTLAPGGAVAGTITHLTASDGTGNQISATDAQIDFATFDALLASSPLSALSGVLASSDMVTLNSTFGVSFNAAGGSDTVTGATAADTLAGGAGDDSIRGALGADQLRGNGGFDTLRGGAGADDIRGGQDGDELYGGAEGDFLAGALGNDFLRGALGNDTLGGGQGDDTVGGGEGNDVLQGGQGYDELTGGLGADQFVFAGAGAATWDTVVGFASAEGDQIVLDGVFFASLEVGVLTEDEFGTELVYSDGALSYDADGAGAGAAVLIATLDGAPALAAEDILVSLP